MSYEPNSVKTGSAFWSWEWIKIWGDTKINKSSGVAEMGDRLAAIDMG